MLMHGKKTPVPADVASAITEKDLVEFLRYILPSQLKESSAAQLQARTRFTELDIRDPALSQSFRPTSPAFFSCRSAFQDQFGVLSTVLKELDGAHGRLLASGSGPIEAPTSAAPPPWLPKEDIEIKLGQRLFDHEYAELTGLFTKLWLHPLGGERARAAVTPFLRFASGTQPMPPKGKVDDQGRGHGVGHRKTSRAEVWVSEGQGSFTVNGRTLAEVFPLSTTRFHAFEPLRLVGALSRFDVVATVTGGGHSGQAGAVRHGLSLALAAHTADFEKPLQEAGMLTRDNRIVERKKPGQRKARRKFQWVKR